jgi:hypothetical protein
MTDPYQALARRIDAEILDLDRTAAAISRHWQKSEKASTDQDAYQNSVALNLHSFYSALERILELIATELDGGTLGGEAWHSELLRQMTLDLPGTRPPVIEQNTAMRLDEYRKFRHRIRNIYATNLDATRMKPLVLELPDLWAQVRLELREFAHFLDELAEG